MENPYQPPRQMPLPQRVKRIRFQPSLGEILFVVGLVCLSVVTHWEYRKLHDLLQIHATLLGIVFETAAMAAWGSTLAVLRFRSSAITSVFRVLIGMAVTVLVTVACCWALQFAGQPPHGLLLPCGVLPGLAATAACRDFFLRVAGSDVI